MDFTFKDDAGIFPIIPRKGGPGFGFCPGKATWYPSVKNSFDLMVLAAETGQPLFSGGLAEQPARVVEELAWFVPDYRDAQFNRRAKAIFGEKKDQEPQQAPAGKNAIRTG